MEQAGGCAGRRVCVGVLTEQLAYGVLVSRTRQNEGIQIPDRARISHQPSIVGEGASAGNVESNLTGTKSTSSQNKLFCQIEMLEIEMGFSCPAYVFRLAFYVRQIPLPVSVAAPSSVLLLRTMLVRMILRVCVCDWSFWVTTKCGIVDIVVTTVSYVFGDVAGGEAVDSISRWDINGGLK